MKTLIFIVLTLFVSVLVTLFAFKNPGYVLIARAPWSIEMSLTTFVMLLIAAFGILYFLAWMMRRLWNIPQDVASWRLNRSAKKARAALTQGLVLLAEGRWAKAHTELVAGLHHSESRLINYLGAACASQALGDTEKRDEYLSLAEKASPHNGLAIAMTQAHLYSWTEQHEQALATLSELKALEPKHSHVLRLLVKTYLALQDWTSLADLIPDLRRNKVLDQDTVDALELQVHHELLMLSLPSDSPEVLKRAWDAVPRTQRRRPELIAIYSSQLIKQGQMNEAESLLRDAINRQWSDDLVELYGRARSDDVSTQLETAEAWLDRQTENPSLLLTLGRLSLYNELWGKARGYLETSVTRRPTAAAYRELGLLMERTGEAKQALDCYHRGLETLVSEAPALPLPPAKSSAETRLATG